MEKDILKQLVSLSNHLDKSGHRKEADYLDDVITKAAEGGFFQRIRDSFKNRRRVRQERKDWNNMDADAQQAQILKRTWEADRQRLQEAIANLESDEGSSLDTNTIMDVVDRSMDDAALNGDFPEVHAENLHAVRDIVCGAQALSRMTWCTRLEAKISEIAENNSE